MDTRRARAGMSELSLISPRFKILAGGFVISRELVSDVEQAGRIQLLVLRKPWAVRKLQIGLPVRTEMMALARQ